jgi:hypothetical protein
MQLRLIPVFTQVFRDIIFLDIISNQCYTAVHRLQEQTQREYYGKYPLQAGDCVFETKLLVAVFIA